MKKITPLSLRARKFISILSVGVFILGAHVSLVGAQSLQDIQSEIQRLSGEVELSQDRIEELREQEDTLQNRLAILREDERQIQSEINKTEQEVAKTKAEIADKEAELQRTKELIQENVKVLYKQGSPSTLEILFSSENFTDFVNRQEYLDRAKANLNEAARESVAIKAELEEKQVVLEDQSAELEVQKNQLIARQQEQERLIEETRGEERRYQEIVSRQEQQLENMLETQRQALAAAAAESRRNNEFITTSGSGGYPWNGQGLTVGNCQPSPRADAPCVDSWDLYKSQCVSYVAWRLAAEGYKVYPFNGRGDAAQWPDTTTRIWANTYGSANAAKVRANPRVGYAAVDPNLSAPYGHVMYIEAVHNDGTITISEYNYIPDAYSERRINPSGLTFLEFARQ